MFSLPILIFIGMNIHRVAGGDLVLSDVARIGFDNLLSLSRPRHSLSSKTVVSSQQLCDLDTSNWLASSEPLVKIAKQSIRQEPSRISPSPKTYRKLWLRDLPENNDNVAENASPEDEIDNEIVAGVTSPLIPQSIWERLTGREFNIPATLERLANMGLFMVTSDSGNDWVEWKPASKETSHAIEQGNECEVLNDDHILVFVGHPKKDGMGSHMPFVKTKSIVHFSAKDVTELLLDSGRVQLYNKFSLGRKDVSVLQEGIDHQGPFGVGETKVVQNLAQPPLINKKMLSVTLMHARPLPSEGQSSGYLVVSRAVGGKQIEESHQVIKNYVLLGVSLIQDLDDHKCLITAITHLYSPALPGFLAARFGLKSAVKFARDLRNLSLVKAS